MTYFNIIALKRAVLTDCPFIIIQLPVVENISFQCQNFNFDVDKLIWVETVENFNFQWFQCNTKQHSPLRL